MNRKITFSVYLETKGRWLTNVQGTFHEWGTTVVTKEDTYFQKSIGIVESNMGKVYEVAPGDIHFTDEK